MSFGVNQCHVSQALHCDIGEQGPRPFMCIQMIKITGAASCWSLCGLYHLHSVMEDQKVFMMGNSCKDLLGCMDSLQPYREINISVAVPLSQALFRVQWLKSDCISFEEMLIDLKCLTSQKQ